jgi:hypothetical protein
VSRKVADSIWAVYASASYIQRYGRPQTTNDLRSHAIVGFDGIMESHRATKWLPIAKVRSLRDVKVSTLNVYPYTYA